MGAPGTLTLRAVRDGDYEYVIDRVDEWWGGRHVTPMLPRLFFVHFADTTVVAVDDATDRVVGFVCGFRSATDPARAYIHFVGVDPRARGAGVGRTLYEWFFERVTELGCATVECVTLPANTGSRAFHAAMGFTEAGADPEDRGQPRVKFLRSLTPPADERPPAPSVDDYLHANLSFWNARVSAHVGSPDYALQKFRDDPAHLSDVVRFDRPRLGDIAGLRGVHLQCHIGTDTVSLARLGATMTGLDLSPGAVDAARRLAADAGVDADFVVADTYDALGVLEPGSFDLVYTGIGALNWLPDIRRWAATVSGLLRPGGRLFIREGHPVLWALADARADGLVALEYPYFETSGVVFGDSGTYAETDEVIGFDWTVEFNHGLGELLTAVMDAGMDVTGFEEHDSIPWIALDGQMEPIGGGEYRLTDRPERLPHSYTLRARKR